jgi:hypothetical protein
MNPRVRRRRPRAAPADAGDRARVSPGRRRTARQRPRRRALPATDARSLRQRRACARGLQRRPGRRRARRSRTDARDAALREERRGARRAAAQLPVAVASRRPPPVPDGLPLASLTPDARRPANASVIQADGAHPNFEGRDMQYHSTCRSPSFRTVTSVDATRIGSGGARVAEEPEGNRQIPSRHRLAWTERGRLSKPLEEVISWVGCVPSRCQLAHSRTSVTSTASTGPSGGSLRYCAYLSLSSMSAHSRSSPSSSTRARPRRRIHQRRPQSSS